MESRAFDGITRSIARGASRRNSLRAAAAALLGAAALPGARADAAATCSETTCTVDKDCCAGVCETVRKSAGQDKGKAVRGICRCVRDGDACARDSDCCQKGVNPMTCKDGVCARPARCIKLTRPCTARDTCCSGVCTSSGSGVCCIPLGVPGCNFNRDCCPDSGFAVCLRGSCTPAVSDARLKEEVAPLTDNLAAVAALRPVRWSWTAESGLGDAPQIGFIAQEVREIVPEVVPEIGGGYLGIDYAKLAAVLAGAVQEQQAEIAGLRERLAALEAAVAGACPPEPAQVSRAGARD